MPRTTLDLDARVLRELKRLKRTNGRSIGQIASELLAGAMSRPDRSDPVPPAGLQWKSTRMGARVDLDNKDAVARALEGR